MSAALSDSHLHPDLDPKEILDGLEVSNLLKWFFVISAAVPMGNDAGVNEQQLVAPYFAFRQCYCSATPIKKRTQVRFWIPLQIPLDYDNMMPRLPENQKFKIPQVGSLTKRFKKTL